MKARAMNSASLLASSTQDIASTKNTLNTFNQTGGRNSTDEPFAANTQLVSRSCTQMPTVKESNDSPKNYASVDPFD